MKKTGMAKSDAKKLMGKMSTPNAASFGNGETVALDRREQRKRDQALGLVPFAVKLNDELVKRLHALATERGLSLNETVAEVLIKGLAA